MQWVGGPSGDWGTAANWSPNPPTAGSDVSIRAGSSITGVTGSVCSLAIQTDPAGTGVTLDGGLGISDGNVALDDGTTLSLLDGAYTLPDGFGVIRSGSQGSATVTVGAGARLGVEGVTRLSDIDLELAGGTISGDVTSAELTQQGSPQFNWTSGSISGSLLLDVINSNVSCTGVCSVAPGADLKTSSLTAVQFLAGTIHDDGSIVNGGILRFVPNTSITGTGVLRNAVVDQVGTVPPTLEFGPQQGVTATGPVTISGVSLDNTQTIDVSSGTPVMLTGATSTFEDGGTLSTPGGVQTPASLTVGHGATLDVKGTTKLQSGFVLALNDGSDGSSAAVVADPTGATLSGTATTSQPIQGTFTWASGRVSGPLTVGPAVATSVTAPSGAGHVLAGILTMGAESTIDAASIQLQSNARLDITARTTLDAPGADIEPAAGATGESVTVASGGTLRRMPASGSGTAPGELATIGVPLVNHGTVELDASLAANGGYSQSSVPNPPAGAPPPLTALLGGISLTSTKTISETGGGIGGKGGITTPTLSIQTSWIGPGYRANCHEVDATFAETCSGTLTVHGALGLHAGADVQVVVHSPTSHDRLVVTKGATLTGRFTVATDSKYTPAYGVTFANLITYASRSGSFTSTASPLAPVGLGWHALYDDLADKDGRGVDARLVDTEAPTIGFAGIPAFTQQDVVQIVYGAEDNKSGVASYDVRWRRVSETGKASAWHYPTTWQHSTHKIRTITGVAEGYTYCAQVRARDRAGNLSAWTAAPCTARMLDDRFLAASRHWQRFSAKAGWYDKTFTRTKTAHVTLKKNAKFTRIAIRAYRCPSCGTLEVFAGSTLVKTWNLASKKTGRTSWVMKKPLTKRATSLTIKTTANRVVVIDAVGLLF